MATNRLALCTTVLLVVIAEVSGAAQHAQDDFAASSALPAIDGPPAPIPPAVVGRDETGNATVRAERVTQPMRIDGRLDEEAYTTVRSFSDFIQQIPREGAPATERTDVWVFFDRENVYVSARCYDSHPERMVATEMRRDSTNIFQNENFTVVLDTFYDRRSGFFFQANSLGGLRDAAIVDDLLDINWNGVWEAKTERFEGGWTTEIAIPFKSLRYRGTGPQVWGFNVRRVVRWKNEISSLRPLAAAYGNVSISRLESAGTLVGVETPSVTRNLEVKPYFASSLTTDRAAAIPFSNDLKGSAGLDFKYGLTRGLIADVTVNTDFAQVEEDLQQVNLTRFSLFFPEKRDFFLEGQGIFNFGGASLRGTGSDVPVMFFSRRIGLSGGQAVPVIAGGRVTGKAGPFGLGVLNIQTDDKSSVGAVATNFSVLRVRRDVLRRSNVGLIATRRMPTAADRDGNVVVGLDANLFFFQNVSVTSYFARTSTPGLMGDDTSYRGRFDYGGDRYGLTVEHLMVGANFSPEVGFVRREDFRRTYGSARFSPRFKRSGPIRRLLWQANLDYVTNAHRTTVENRQAAGSFGIEFDSSDTWEVELAHDYEWLPRDFGIFPGIIVPTGGYKSQTVRTFYRLGEQRPVAGAMTAARGTFYGGIKTETSYVGRIGLGARCALEPSLTFHWIDLPFGSFTTQLAGTRIVVTPTPRLQVSSLVQYNATAHTLNSSVRLRWEYIIGSDLFVVYSDGRDTAGSGASGLLNRSIALKVTRMVRF